MKTRRDLTIDTCSVKRISEVACQLQLNEIIAFEIMGQESSLSGIWRDENNRLFIQGCGFKFSRIILESEDSIQPHEVKKTLIDPFLKQMANDKCSLKWYTFNDDVTEDDGWSIVE